jgi:hypothetical protein
MTAIGYAGGDPTKVNKAGDTMTGQLLLAGDPVSGLGAAPRQYVDSHGGGGGSVASVFGRSGVVVAQAGDYSPAQVGADPAGTAASQASAALSAALAASLQRSSNLGDLTNVVTARTNLGLGSAALQPSSAFDVAGAAAAAQAASQPLDGTLTALAGLDSAAGMVVETAADVFTKRSLAAGSTSVAITNPSGVAGNPTIDVVPANFAGIPESAITNLTADLAARALASRTITTTAPLTGGGDLSANRTIGITLGASDIPALPTSKITSGVFLPSFVADTEIQNLISGAWWACPDIGATGTLTMPVSGTACFVCLAPARDCTLAGLIAEISTNDAAGVVRFGLASDINGQPGVWLNDFGTAVATSIALIQPGSTPSVALTGGTRYWVAVIPQSTSAGLVMRTHSSNERHIPMSLSAAPGSLNVIRNGYTTTGIAGALSIGSAVGTLAVASVPMIAAKLT